ncbi:uncharacterized protein LOC116270956 [Papio anubis]|uniref:uncharacterized protein LOC116270956 n=1 Tax=Papio anubis TaxID=9555 RepID=UPI0012AE4038|nr:uncharacterized protein LOC116270956 [Papio anubis]
MREGLGAACEAAGPRLCRLLCRILRPKPACCLRGASMHTLENTAKNMEYNTLSNQEEERRWGWGAVGQTDHEQFTPTLRTQFPYLSNEGTGRGNSKSPLHPQIPHLILAVSFHSLVTQDDLQYHSLSKQQNESPQPLVGTGKKSPESLVKPDATPLSSPRHVRIKNWGSGMTFQDTLHHKAKGVRLGLQGEPLWPKLVKLPRLCGSNRCPPGQTKQSSAWAKGSGNRDILHRLQ